jgi:hypothetical protein
MTYLLGSPDCHKMSMAQEERVAKDIGGQRVIGSGALWGKKGDSRSSQYLVECKITSSSYYTLTLDVWKKIVREAVNDGLRIPVMNIDLEYGNKSFAVLSLSDYEELITKDLKDLGKEIKLKQKSYRVTSICRLNLNGTRLIVFDWEVFKELNKGE